MTRNDSSLRQARLRKVRRLRRRRRAAKAGKYSVFGLIAAGTFVAVAVFVILDQTVRAPDWLRDRVETRLEASANGLQIDFGNVEFVIREGWRPRLALRDVRIEDGEGRPVLALSDLRISLAMRPLLRGRLQPKSIDMSGVFATLRRDADGAFSLAFEGGAFAVQGDGSIAAMLHQVESIFSAPQLAALTEATMTQVSLRYEDAVSGQAWTVDGGAFRLTREGDELRIGANLSLLGGRDFASAMEFNYTSNIGETAASLGVSLTDVPARDLASQSVALSWLEALRAPLSGSMRSSIDEDGALGPVNVAFQIGAGALQPTDQARPIPFDAARAYFTYLPGDGVLAFDEISVDSPWVTGTADGITVLNGIETGTLTSLVSQMRLTRTQLNPADAFPDPITITQASADFKLSLDPFTLTLGEMLIEDATSDLRLSGDLSVTQEGWVVGIDAQMDALTPERLIELWPPSVIEKPRDWIARNLSGGLLHDVNLALRARPNARPDIYLDFDYTDAQIRFMRAMPPITGASGQATLVGNRFVTTANVGQVMAEDGGAVDVAGTSFIIPDTTIRRAAPGVVRLQGRGSITSVLSLLNREPLRVMERPGLPVTVADGTAVFQGNLAVPLKRGVIFDDVEFFVDGRATEVASTVLVPGHTLAAPVLSIFATQDGITIDGAGLISNVPVLAEWQQVFGQPGSGSTLQGSVVLNQATLDAFQIGLPPGSVSGEGRADIVLDLPQGGPPNLQLTSDLVGLTLRLPELGWSKRDGQDGRLTVDADLAQPAVVRNLELSAPGLDAQGTVRVSPGGGLDVAEFTRVRRSDWMDVRARLDGQGPGRAPLIRILGGTLDLRRATFEASGGGGGRAPAGRNALTVALDRLQVTDTIALSGFEGSFALQGGFQGEFQGRINGQTPVTGAVVPDGERSAVRVQSDDAGGVFRDSGLLRQAFGGSFDMTLRPVGEPGTFDGTLNVAETSVRNAPGLAALLNAISVVGLLTELSGQGIYFTEVAARFRLSPSEVTLYESRATGPSLGLTMDGVYDVITQRLSMQGVISPVYLLNQIGGVFAPRRGEGLFGFTYALSGAAQSPRVAVNPLSGLTPGPLREIFRTEPAPSLGTSGPAPAPPRQPSAGDR